MLEEGRQSPSGSDLNPYPPPTPPLSAPHPSQRPPRRLPPSDPSPSRGRRPTVDTGGAPAHRPALSLGSWGGERSSHRSLVGSSRQRRARRPPGRRRQSYKPVLAAPIGAEAAPPERKESRCAPCPRPSRCHTGRRAVRRARRPTWSPRPCLLALPPAVPPRPEAGVCRQGEWAEAGWVTSSNPPRDAPGTQGARPGGDTGSCPRAKREPPIRASECPS